MQSNLVWKVTGYKVAGLIEALSYKPVELGFGTSGLRGLVSDMTDLECYINAVGFLEFEGLSPGSVVFVAGDLRGSTPRITAAVVKAVKDMGLRPVYCGLVPTPTVAFYALENNAPCIMVTGSHIPADRNGIKFYKASGEVLKEDEEAIKKQVAAKRAYIYEASLADSGFTAEGMLAESGFLPKIDKGAETKFMERYEGFAGQPLRNKHIVVYQHSAVGRDMLCVMLEKLGARVTPVGRSDTFISIDTENVTPDNKAYFHSVAKKHPDNFAIVSTDGDSDRPFVIDEHGEFYRGDVLGCLVAKELGAEFVAVPISSNDAVDEFCAVNNIEVVHTKIGSPYVIKAMQTQEHKKVAGWEVNGGFLVGTEAQFMGVKLKPLPTRDAFLPILVVLMSAAEKSLAVSDVFSQLPKRYTGGGLVDNVPMDKISRFKELCEDKAKIAVALQQAFRGTDILDLRKAPPSPGQITSAGSGLSSLDVPIGTSPSAKPLPTRANLPWERAILRKSSIGIAEQIDLTDGLRLIFASGDVIHLRPSGNAPQFRVYTNSSSQAEADQLAEKAVSAGGYIKILLGIL